jgi:hypothetical protein
MLDHGCIHALNSIDNQIYGVWLSACDMARTYQRAAYGLCMPLFLNICLDELKLMPCDCLDNLILMHLGVDIQKMKIDCER